VIPLGTKPGTEVICINAGGWSRRCPFRLREGAIYTVRGWTDELFTGNPLVDLVEVYHDEWAAEPWRFRLLDLAGLGELLSEGAHLPIKERTS
jgi:hypothetical protein